MDTNCLRMIVTDFFLGGGGGGGGGGKLMLYLNEEIPCKFLNNHPLVPNSEVTCIECHQLKRNWFLLTKF